MSIAYFKKERGGVNPVSPIIPHIYRDPPAAKFTRKYEPVNISEIMFMSNPESEYGDPTRTNEMINFYARGKNPMVSIDYGAGQFASNPYKVEVVRPPMQPANTLNAITRPDVHQNYAVQTNPRIEPLSIGNQVDRALIDKPIIKDTNNGGQITATPSITYYEMMDQLTRNAASKTRAEDVVLRGSIRPTSTYSMDTNRDTNFIRTTVVGDTNVYSVNSNVAFSQQTTNPLAMTQEVSKNALQDLSSFGVTANATFGNVVVFDPKTNASLDLASTVKDKHYIAVNAAFGKPLTFNTNDGREIVLKDYTYSVVNSAVGNPQLIIQVDQPEIVLERNTPLFTASSNLRGMGDADAGARIGAGSIHLEQNVPLASVTAAYHHNGMASENIRAGQDQYHLDKRQAHFGEFNRYGMPDHQMRQPIYTGLQKKDRFNQTARMGHQMNMMRME